MRMQITFWWRYGLYCLWRSVLDCLKPSTELLIGEYVTLSNVNGSETENSFRTPCSGELGTLCIKV